MSHGRSFGRRDGVALVVVLFGHVLLVLLFARMREQERGVAESVHRSTLFLLDVTPRTSPARPIVTTPWISPPKISVPPPETPILTDVVPGAPSIRDRAMDWRGEAERSARNSMEAQAVKPRGFEEKAPQLRAPKRRQFNWDPSPGRFGFSGGLPYMELGKRCAIGLGFFACGIGELPPPDGTLFDGMKDADRERSSIPDIPR